MVKWLKKKTESEDGESKNSTNEDSSRTEKNDAESESEKDEASSKSAQDDEEPTNVSVRDRQSENVPAVDELNSETNLSDGTYSDNVSAAESTPDEDKKQNTDDSQSGASLVEDDSDETTCDQTAPGESFETEPSTIEKLDLAAKEDSQTTQITQDAERREFTFDEAVDLAGYGRFQKVLTMLVGMCWFADAFEVLSLTILADFIACDWHMYVWQEALLTTNMFIGMIFGGPVFGILADTLGRRKTVAISMLNVFIFGGLSAASPNLETLLTLRFFVGFALGSLAQGVTLCVEYYPLRYRGIAGFYINYYWSFGNVFLIVISWLVMESTKAWRYLLFAVSLPALFVFFSTRWYPESVRYYLVTDQYKAAVAQLKCLVAVNKASLPPGRKLKKISVDDEEEKKVGGKPWELLKRPHTLSTLLFWYIWFALAFHYYGLALMTPVIVREGRVFVQLDTAANATGLNATRTGFFFTTSPCKHLTSANYLDLLWTSSAEVPGMWIFSMLVQCTQRKRLLAVTVLINTVLVPFLLVDFNSKIPGKIILFIARANIGGVFQLIMIMTSEAFPTTLRATSMGSCHAFSMIGAALVPFAAEVLIINEPVVAVCLMSAAVLLCAFAAVLLPREMKGRHIKDLSEEYKQVERETTMI